MKSVFLFALLFCIANRGKSQTTTDTVLSKPEVEAGFPGGLPAFKLFLQKNLRPQVPINKHAPAGVYTTITRFLVDTDGKVSDVRTETSVGYGMDEEAIRVIAKSKKWIPAMQNRLKVKAYRRQPITFVVSEE